MLWRRCWHPPARPAALPAGSRPPTSSTTLRCSGPAAFPQATNCRAQTSGCSSEVRLPPVPTTLPAGVTAQIRQLCVPTGSLVKPYMLVKQALRMLYRNPTLYQDVSATLGVERVLSGRGVPGVPSPPSTCVADTELGLPACPVGQQLCSGTQRPDPPGPASAPTLLPDGKTIGTARMPTPVRAHAHPHSHGLVPVPDPCSLLHQGYCGLPSMSPHSQPPPTVISQMVLTAGDTILQDLSSQVTPVLPAHLFNSSVSLC